MLNTDRTKTLNALLQLLLEAKKLNAVRIRIEPADSNSGEQILSFFAPDPQTKLPVPVKESALDQDEVNKLVDCLNGRTFCWPNCGDNLFETCLPQTKRLLFAPLSPFRLLADYAASRKSGRITYNVMLDNIVWSDIPAVTELLLMQETDKQALLCAAKNKSGIVLTNRTSEPGSISAAAIVLALRPDAIFYPQENGLASLTEILAAAADHLVLLAQEGNDPVDIIYSFLGGTQNPEQYFDCCRKLRLSYIHRRVQRTCASCAKSTTVTQSSLEKVPQVLLPLTKDSYMFSRGCVKCGNSAYRGELGLDSVICLTPELQQLLNDRSSAEVFTQAAYSCGARPLLENGLRKIYSGLTSFEQVFKVAPRISPAFVMAANKAAEIKPAPDLKQGTAGAAPTPRNIEAEQKQHQPEASIVPSKNRRLLIVEDEIHQREILQLVFEREGYEVVLAENGSHALEVLRQKNIDAVICDVMMPVQNGFDFIQAVREKTVHKSLPVLMLTAVENSDDECSLLSLGADDYCAKNVKRKILLQRVERLLERKKKENPVGHLLEAEE